jgi:hypothetical protein
VKHTNAKKRKEKTMGMDLYGINPKDTLGEYAQYNIFRWQPLATVCCAIAPAATAPCQHWYTNDNDGLSGTESEWLADKLEEALQDGSVDECLRQLPESVFERVNVILSITLEPGANLVTPLPGRDYDWRLQCRQDIPDFILFLRACGGFRIT